MGPDAPAGQSFTQTLSGGLSFTGAVAKQTHYATAGSLSFSGALNRNVDALVSGGLSFAGLSNHATAASLTGNLSFSGLPNKATSTLLNGGLSFIGTSARQTDYALVGSLPFSGNFSSGVVFVLGLDGSLTFAGTQARNTDLLLPGSLSFDGIYGPTQTSSSLSANLTPDGSLNREMMIPLHGELSFEGQSALHAILALLASLSLDGKISRQTDKTLNDALLFFAGEAHLDTLPFGGDLSFSGALATLLTTVTPLVIVPPPPGTSNVRARMHNKAARGYFRRNSVTVRGRIR